MRLSALPSSYRYSAKLIGQNWKSLMVSVGTVFNQVILWTVTGPFDELGHAEVMHTLTGHQVYYKASVAKVLWAWKF